MTLLTNSRRPAASRRELRFASIEEVVPEVRRLAPSHRTTGSWSLGQICRHLADSFMGSMEGFDLRNHRLKRLLFSRQMLHSALTKGIPLNYTVDPRLTPPGDVSLSDGFEALEVAIGRYLAHGGPLHAHPLFGAMSRETWDRVHCVHCAHHLSLVW